MSLFKKESTWNKALLWFLYGTALTPLVFWNDFFYPFIVPKAVFFRTLVALATALFLYLFATGKLSINTGILKKKLVWLPGLFLVVSFVSSFFGLDFTKSLWSEYSRSEGLLTLTHLVIYFYLLILVFKRDEWNTLIKIISGVSIVVALSALLEYMGALKLVPQSGSGRAGGLINNPAFLSAYLLFTAPITLYLALGYKDEGKKNYYYIFGAGALLSFLTILISETRGAALGALGALLILLTFGTRYFDSKKARKYAGIILIGLVLLGMGGVFFKDELKASSIGIISRLAHISLSDETTISRLFVWKETLPEVLKRPILGHGTETFEYLYNKHYDPSVVPEEWFDRSHNVYLDRLLEGGIVGFLLYAGMLVSLLYYLWKRRDNDKRAFFIFGFAALAYMGQNFFVFDSISSLVMFYGFLAWQTARFYEDEDEAMEYTKGGVVQIILFLLALLAIVSVYFFGYRQFTANSLLYEGYSYQIVDVDRSIGAWQDGNSRVPYYGREFGYQAYDSYFNKIAEGVDANNLGRSF
ncbi:hypothetical protein CL654_03260, partial [bacterium]|nr:hypothetical protein [bacterium]